MADDDYYQLPHGNVILLSNETSLPSADQALEEPNGLLAIGGTLSTGRLLEAYTKGIFPWFSENEPIMWWSPNPRMVLFPNELVIKKSLKKTLKKQIFTNTINTAFRQVISACANVIRPDQNGTWINQEMIDAYTALHQQGYAISSESWLDDQLVGGCYGVIIGKMFYGESMFHTRADASKVAFTYLVEHLIQCNVGMIDCQMKTPLLASFGAREIARDKFIQNLTKLVN